MKPVRALLALLPLVASLATGGSCVSNTPSPYDDVAWQCSQSHATCDCHGAPSGSTTNDGELAACDAELDCCFVVDHGSGSFDCTCIPTPEDPPASADAAGAGGEGGAAPERSQAARCASAAAAHDSTTVTPHCPPVALDNAGVCAVTFESCEPAYLRSNGLVACCDGTVCKSDSSGQAVCQAQ